MLRQPLEDKNVTISRASGSILFPTNFLCVAAMNPCPCGNLGHPDKPCKDTQLQIERYRSKISGPLWDRIDMHIDVPPLRYSDLTGGGPSETSDMVRNRVLQARRIQRHRFGTAKTNGNMSSREIKQHCILDAACMNLIRHAMDELGMSARACDRLLRVSRTIADLANSPQIAQDHLMEAIHFRNLQVSL